MRDARDGVVLRYPERIESTEIPAEPGNLSVIASNPGEIQPASERLFSSLSLRERRTDIGKTFSSTGCNAGNSSSGIQIAQWNMKQNKRLASSASRAVEAIHMTTHKTHKEHEQCQRGARKMSDGTNTSKRAS